MTERERCGKWMPRAKEACALGVDHSASCSAADSIKYHRKRERQRQREYRKDPEFLEYKRQRQREYRKDPEFREYEREYEREYRATTIKGATKYLTKNISPEDRAKVWAEMERAMELLNNTVPETTEEYQETIERIINNA